jgi:hypothetical protein
MVLPEGLGMSWGGAIEVLDMQHEGDKKEDRV